MRSVIVSVAVALVCCLFVGLGTASEMSTESATSEWDYSLEHSLDGVTFEPRNQFRVVVTDIDSGKKKVEFSPYDITADEVAKIEALSRAGESYRLRTNVRPAGSPPAYIMAHVPACSLVDSGLVERIIFHLDSQERVVSFEYANLAVDPSATVCQEGFASQVKKLKSKGAVDSFESSKLPVAIDGNIFYNAPKGATGAQGSGSGNGKDKKPAQEQTFFQKYKWYILGLGGYVLVSTMMNPQLQEAAKQQQAKK